MTLLHVVSVNLSQHQGTVKQPVAEIAIDRHGVLGDAHAGPGHRQVSLLAQESIDRFAVELGRPLGPGEFGENLTVRGLPSRGVAPLDRLVFGNVELEVTQIGKKCHGSGCAIFQQVGKCVMPAEGIFARVVRGGTIRPADCGEHRPRPLRVLVVTLSDRAAAGQYADRSGPRIKELLEAHFAQRQRQVTIANVVLPDDPERLRQQLVSAIDAGVDAIFTTGGTGVGPRDFTPETVAPLCQRLIPGIMEHIRLKFGEKNPNARLSRSIAGIAGQTQIYTLPGSVRAVDEYVPEILATLEHLVMMVHGLDTH